MKSANRFSRLVVLVIAFCGCTPAAIADDPLIGLWSYETTFGTTLTGELKIIQTGRSTGRAVVGDLETEFTTKIPLRFEFEFPGGVGGFRGWMNIGPMSILPGAGPIHREIHGLWTRPAATGDPRFPGGSSQAFATPMTLLPSGPLTFVGVLRPLPNPFTLYLSVFRGEDGALMAAFRNPEQNSHGPAMQYRVARNGSAVHFTAGPDPTKPDYRLEAKYLSSTQRIRIDWPDAGGEIELVRRTPGEAANFFPRPPGSPPYLYREPPAVEGWQSARAGDLGLDEAAITRMVQSIIDDDPAGRRPSLIHSLLIAYRGKLVLEEYFFGFDRNQPHDLRSAGKTFASVLLGNAIAEGSGLGADTTIYPLMAGRGPFANSDPRTSEITLAHLLTHSAGLACDDNDDASPGNENTMQTQTAQPDWWKFTLDLPMAHDPGKRYAYCSANINLVGAALTTETGTWLPELFDQNIAQKLEFGEWHWNLMPNGEGYLGGGIFVRPRDLLKVGQAYLGGWNDRQIVTAEWIEQSTSPRVQITPETTGLSAEDFSNSYFGGEDALAWHLTGLRSGKRRYDAFAATGNGGQLLIVVPELQLTAVFTGGNYLQGGIWGRWADRLIGEFIVPGIKKGE